MRAPSSNTPTRSIRVSDDRWLPARAKAEAQGETLTDVVRRVMTKYVEQSDQRHRAVEEA